MAAQEETLRAALDLLTAPAPTRLAASAFAVEDLSTSDLRRLNRQVKRTRAWNLAGNVVAYGIAEKQAGASRTGDLALTIYVKKKFSKSALDLPQVVPSSLELEGLNEQVPTDVREIGELRLEPLTAKIRPIFGGYSIGHLSNTGSVGCLVIEQGNDGKRLLLSNSHVLAASGTARVGDPIYQPGPSEQDTTMDVVARLKWWQPFNFAAEFVNRVDAALAELVDDSWFDPTIFDIGKPKGMRAPVRGMRVQKTGRTTGHTWGEVFDVNARFALPYPRPDGMGSAEVRFRDQVFCTRYTASGDSGALVLDEDENAVGLHFAGSDSVSVFSPIQFVLDDLAVQLVT